MALSPKLRCPRCGKKLRDCGGCKAPVHFRILIEAPAPEVAERLPDFALSTQSIGLFAVLTPERREVEGVIADLELWGARFAVQPLIEAPDGFWPRFDGNVAPRCGGCGFPNASANVFCENCGKRLQIMIEVRTDSTNAQALADAAMGVGLSAAVGSDRVLIHGDGPPIGILGEQVEALGIDARWMPFLHWDDGVATALTLDAPPPAVVDGPPPIALSPTANIPSLPTPGLELDFGHVEAGPAPPTDGLELDLPPPPRLVTPEPKMAEPQPTHAPATHAPAADASRPRLGPSHAESGANATKKRLDLVPMALIGLVVLLAVVAGIVMLSDDDPQPPSVETAELEASEPTTFEPENICRAREVTVRLEDDQVAVSGVVVTAEGHVLTVLSTLGAGSLFKARFAGVDWPVSMKIMRTSQQHDLALLKPDPPLDGRPFAQLASSAELPPRSAVLIPGQPRQSRAVVGVVRTGATPKWFNSQLHLWLSLERPPSTAVGAPIVRPNGKVVGLLVRRETADGPEALGVFTEHALAPDGVLRGVVDPLPPGRRYAELYGEGPPEQRGGKARKGIDVLHSGYYEWRGRSSGDCTSATEVWAKSCRKGLTVMLERVTEHTEGWDGPLELQCQEPNGVWLTVTSSPKVAWKKGDPRRMAIGQDRLVTVSARKATAQGKQVRYSTANARFSGVKVARFADRLELRRIRCRVARDARRTGPFPVEP